MRKLLLVLLLLFPVTIYSQGTTNYPSSLDNSASLPVAADSKVTYLTASATNSVTTFTVNSTTGFPSSGVLVAPSGELVAYSGTSVTTFTGLTRGFSGTVAQAYAVNAIVKLSLSAAYVNGSRGAAIAIETKIGIDGSGGTATPTNAGDVLTVTASGATKWKPPATSGDVVGPSSSVDDEVVLFSGTSGKLIKRASTSGILKLTSGVIGAAAQGVDYYAPGGTDVAVVDGGTGSSTAGGARTNLGVVIGTDVEAHDPDLTTIAGLAPTTDNFIVAVSSAWASRTVAQVKSTLSLNNLTNDAQTKASIVPNTAPSAGQVLAGNAGGTAYAPVSMSGDCSFASTGSIICTKTNAVSFGSFATGTNAANLTGTAPASVLPNPSSSTLGGVQSLAAVSHKWINTISTSGVPAATQPAAADLSDGTTGTVSVVMSNAPTLTGQLTLNATVANALVFNSSAANGGYIQMDRSGVSYGYLGNAVAIGMSNSPTNADLGAYSNADYYLEAAGNDVVVKSTRVRFSSYGAGTATFDSSGNITSSSDERLKTNINDFDRGLSAVLGLRPITYHWSKESGLEPRDTYTGFSAQNVQQHIPEAVGVDSRGYLSLSDRTILAALVNADKEIDQRLQMLADRVTKLENENSRLKARLRKRR
jgi:hypothetical protein